MSSYNLIARVRCPFPEDLLPLLERARGVRWLGADRPCGRFGLRGTPLKRLAVLIEQALDHDRLVTVEVGLRQGAVSGEWIQLTVRRAIPDAPVGWLSIQQTDVPEGRGTIGSWWVGLRTDQGLAWEGSFGRFRSELDDTGPERLLVSCWARWFRHIDADELDALTATWRIPLECATLAEAFRAASLELERLSRELGWFRVTTHTRKRLVLGADWPTWVREERIQERYTLMDLSATGCGEATLEAARTGHWPLDEGVPCP